MSQDLILQLIEVAIALAQSQLEPGEAASTFAGIAQRAESAYVAQTGQPLDTLMIKAEEPL
jgi:hypothetical protein